jgi:hypothetical protein
MSCLFTIDLDGNLRADQSAGGAAGAAVPFIKLGDKISLDVELL